MPAMWGHDSSSEPRFGPDRWHAIVLLIAAVIVLGVLRYADAKQHRQAFVEADVLRQRIVILPATPDAWSLCDGHGGACFEISNLRAATRALRGVR